MPCPKRCPNGTTCDKKAGRCAPKETIGQIAVQKTLKRFPNTRLNANSKIVKDTAQKLDDLTDPAKSRSAIAWFKRRINDTEFVVRTLYEYKFILLAAGVVADHYTGGRLSKLYGTLLGKGKTIPENIKQAVINERAVSGEPIHRVATGVGRTVYQYLFSSPLPGAKNHTWSDVKLKEQLDTYIQLQRSERPGKSDAIAGIIQYMKNSHTMCSNPDDGNVMIEILLEILKRAELENNLNTLTPTVRAKIKDFRLKLLAIASKHPNC